MLFIWRKLETTQSWVRIVPHRARCEKGVECNVPGVVCNVWPNKNHSWQLLKVGSHAMGGEAGRITLAAPGCAALRFPPSMAAERQRVMRTLETQFGIFVTLERIVE